jgi:hypothetical protein
MTDRMGRQRGQVLPAGLAARSSSRRSAAVATAFLVPVAVACLGGPAAGEDLLPFTNEAARRGVQYTMKAYPPSGGRAGFGMALADLDTDGDLDLVLLGRSNGMVGLFENDGTGHFTNRSFGSGLVPAVKASVVLAFDYDGDGDLDLFVGEYMGSNRLYRHDGGLEFTEVTLAAGVGGQFATKGASVADFDGDGWLDLHVCNYFENLPAATRNRLYRNRGDGTFEEVSAAWGLDLTHPTLQSIFSDVDGDLWPDLYLSNDRGPLIWPNQLFRNTQGGFVEISDGSGAEVSLYSMGIAAGDLNGDGLPDFYLTNIPSPVPPLEGANPLLLSRGDGTYEQAQDAWGVAHHQMSWAAILWDFDNDGHLDLYVNNEWEANSLYAHDGTPPMREIAAEVGLEGTASNSFVSIVGDIDGDGDLDLIQNNHGTGVRVYVNHEGSRRRSLRLRIAGTHPNHHAIGATATVRFGERSQWAQVLVGGNGYLGQNETILHFGLGEAEIADEIEVRWPAGGPTRRLRNLPAGATWTAIHPANLGDANGDGVVDHTDLQRLCEWIGGPVSPGREALDLDGDGSIGPLDAAAFWAIASIERGDLDGDGLVGGADLATLLGDWGGAACRSDLDLDGSVGGGDLAILLANWTAAP